MSDSFRRAEKGGKSVYMNVGIWFNEETGHIHLTVPGSGWFHTTVNDNPDSKRCHPNLFFKLAKALKEAGAPHPEIPVSEYE